VQATFVFKNEPETDFRIPANTDAFRAALRHVESQLGRGYGAIIDGHDVTSGTSFSSTSPADPKRVIGTFPDLDASEAVRALMAADRAFPTWSRVPVSERVAMVGAVADQIRKRRHELSAWMVYEVGKSWREADGEVAESIDLLEYYAQQMLLLDGPQNQRLATVPGERTEFFYVPLGAGVVISPWNFPLALTFGMASAAIVAGNTVVIKPASNSPTCVHQLAKMFVTAGLPPGVLNVVTGRGTVIGNALVDHPRTRFIAFTGSMEVGLGLQERAAKMQPGQIWIKRTVLELGGKNAVIVDRDADLDAAADGVIASAFGFQGQKCSAGSRAIIDETVYDEFMPYLVDRASKLRVGDPVNPDVTVGPVIDERACKSILRYIEIGKREGSLLLGGERAPGSGYFVEPTIFGDVDPKATIAQEEIFGPVLACIKARDFDDALEIANGTKYGLTGAVFSRDRAKLDRARREFHVGNLYLNRKSTGALMGVHPFGGFNMSGTDSKAGGPDYLLLFLQGKSVGDRMP
jgi:1-pyrroline-5-carboxylate dehydrogenase